MLKYTVLIEYFKFKYIKILNTYIKYPYMNNNIFTWNFTTFALIVNKFTKNLTNNQIIKENPSTVLKKKKYVVNFFSIKK